MVLILWIIFVIYVSCLSCFLVCSLQPCCHLLGKGWHLALLYVLLYPRYEVYRGYIVFAFFCNYVCWFVCLSVNFFSVKDFSATAWVRILKFSTKVDKCVVLCNKKTATYYVSVPLFIHFSFSPMEISVTDFSALIGASVLKFCVHLQVGKVYGVNGN